MLLCVTMRNHLERHKGWRRLGSRRVAISTLLLAATIGAGGQTPDKPFNGKILVRTRSDLHRKAAQRAAAEGVSISQWVSRRIEAA